jgi:hypothetical protein
LRIRSVFFHHGVSAGQPAGRTSYYLNLHRAARHVHHLREAYSGARRPVQVARTRLFRIGAQFTWTFLFAAVDQVLDPKPDPDFDYAGEAELRWSVTLAKTEDADFGTVLATIQASE